MASWIKDGLILAFIKTLFYGAIFYFDLLAGKRWAVISLVVFATVLILSVILFLEALSAKSVS